MKHPSFVTSFYVFQQTTVYKTTSVTLTSHEQLKFEHYVYLLNYAILKWTFEVFRTTDCNTAAEKTVSLQAKDVLPNTPHAGRNVDHTAPAVCALPSPPAATEWSRLLLYDVI